MHLGSSTSSSSFQLEVLREIFCRLRELHTLNSLSSLLYFFFYEKICHFIDGLHFSCSLLQTKEQELLLFYFNDSYTNHLFRENVFPMGGSNYVKFSPNIGNRGTQIHMIRTLHTYILFSVKSFYNNSNEKKEKNMKQK